MKDHHGPLVFLISSPEHKVLRVSYCDQSPSVGIRLAVWPSVVRTFTFPCYTLASTNINQSAPNLVQMYMTIRARMSTIMELIGCELFELSALEYENLPYANIDQSVPNSATVYMPIRSRMSSIKGEIEVERPELYALEFGKIAEYDCLHSSIYKYQPINTKLGQNVCDYKISDEFHY